MGKRGIVLEEKLWFDETFLFQSETLSPIFCKPKLIPLKTITTQKLEQMQKEMMEKLKFPEPENMGEPQTGEQEPEQSSSGNVEKKATDVWTADD